MEACEQEEEEREEGEGIEEEGTVRAADGRMFQDEGRAFMTHFTENWIQKVCFWWKSCSVDRIFDALSCSHT